MSSDAQTSSGDHVGETLSCVACRNRKLKCDRTKPRCNRCERTKTECIFPESRRKPAFKRRNVKELEARLAQVEKLLKENSQSKSPRDGAAESTHLESVEVPAVEDDLFQGMDFTDPDLNDGGAFVFQPDPTGTFSTGNLGGMGQDASPLNGDLMDLGGIYESLPPFDVMEDLNRFFFERQQHIVPVIHSSRYLHAFYSAPHMKPPMCLRYAIWALASHGHPKYNPYHDVFYRRARQYADSDELKGYGEHFITVGHAQAWCIIATYEAKCLMFTRAAMTCSRAVRLVQMMGLHRLDGAAEEISPTLLPPQDWAELEERRRVFWGVFCIDSHCSISTGWPHLIDASEITTLLPAPETAFNDGTQVETCSIQNAFKGRPYSSFAGAVLVCHIFNEILKHVHKPKPNDNPDNYEFGEYWQRHRDIDNTLSSAFMYLPESFRLPDNYRDPVAVHTNLNFHASIICLHHAAIDRIDAYKLPESAKKMSQDRMTTAAQEIVNIIKLTCHVNSAPRSPLASLALYCAASVYVYMCKDAQAPAYADNLDFVIAAMEAFGRSHTITQAFLRQVVLDIERNDVQQFVRLPRLDSLSEDFNTQISQNIPLVARSTISRHSKVQPPLPGRLPLGKPVGKIISDESGCEYGTWVSDSSLFDSFSPERPLTDLGGTQNKRKRTSPFIPTATSTMDASSESSDRFWATSGVQDRVSTNPSTYSSPTNPLGAMAAAKAASIAHPISCGSGFIQHQVNLPHRTGSPSLNANTNANNPNNEPTSAPQPQERSNVRLGVGIAAAMLGNMGRPPFRTAGREHGRSRPATASAGMDDWEVAGMCMHNQFATNGPGAAFPDPAGQRDGFENVPWSMAGNEDMNIDWDAIGASFGIEPVGVAGGSGGGGGTGSGAE
ncbi:fungal-specific transcription factor domain-containing protein [Hypoxylon sp. FL1150]|nr:fungal-specific transcription factor domain-containing protein [Hypoxylon sp. FL1150]